MTTDYIDIGDDHSIKYIEYKEFGPVGINVKHLTKEGKVCNGWVPFKGKAWEQGFAPGQIEAWDIKSEDPLTLEPSILCTVCGDHGFIRLGRWVVA